MPEHMRIKVNGETKDVVIEPQMTLLEMLREELRLTGAKRACEKGDCGACTVLLDGSPVNACLILALDARGKEITTIEGLAENGKLHPLQEAFYERAASQCGFCTPGMILSAKALIDYNPQPSPNEIKHALSGNLCRCTGYHKIIEAVSEAAKTMNEKP